MTRREFIAVLGGAAAWSLAARAQQTTIPVIGYLSQDSAEFDTIRLTGFRRGLSQSGYVEGRNVAIAYRFAGNQLDRLSALAADLVQDRVTVIVTPGLPSTLAARAVTSTVPIVFSVGRDPVQPGLVASLNRPGGNVTGVYPFTSELEVKGLELLHELLPATTALGLLENPRNPIAAFMTRDVLAAANAIRVEIQVLHASTEGEIDAAFIRLAQERTGALLVPADVFFDSRITQLAALATRYAVPMLCGIREFPLAGGLMSYGFNLAEIYQLAGLQVAHIIKGEKPADLPVIQLSKTEFVINLKTAKSLGLTVPPSLLGRANEVME